MAGDPEGRLVINFIPQLPKPGFRTPEVSMWACKFGNIYNHISFIELCSRDTNVTEVTRYRENVMQLYVSMSQTLIALLAPDYVWIGEIGENQSSVEGDDVLARQIPVIYWANYFGPNYLPTEIEDSMLNAPVGTARRLEGGIWYQLHENFDVLDTELVTEMEDKAASYFRNVFNLDGVQWLYRWEY